MTDFDALDRLAGDAEHLGNVDSVPREVVEFAVVGPRRGGVGVVLLNLADAVSNQPDGSVIQTQDEAQQSAVDPERVSELARDERL